MSSIERDLCQRSDKSAPARVAFDRELAHDIFTVAIVEDVDDAQRRRRRSDDLPRLQVTKKRLSCMCRRWQAPSQHIKEWTR